MKKRIFTFLCAIALSVCATAAFAADRLLPNLQKMEELSSVYVGKALLRMVSDGAGNNLSLPNASINPSDFIKYLDSVEVINAGNKKSADYLRPLVENALKKLSDIELAMETEDDGEYTQIYVTPAADGKSYSRLLIINSDKDECNVIDMQGKIPVDLLNQISL